MTYQLVYSERALKAFKKLDKNTARMILAWLSKHIDGTTTPRAHGKGLTADKSGLWRYRIGNYRAIVKIEDDKVIVLVLDIGHRKDIYKTFKG